MINAALRSGNVEMVDYLLSESTTDLMQDKDFLDDIVVNALHSRSFEFLKKLLDKNPWLIQRKYRYDGLDASYRNISLLQHATACGSQDMVEYLIDKGLDITEKDGGGRSLLCWAVFHGRLELVDYFLNLGSSNLLAMSPQVMVDAGHAGSIEIFNKLLDSGFDPLKSNEYDVTCLHMAATNGHEDLAFFIMEKYPELMTRISRSKWSTLHYAVQGGSLKLVQYLIEKGLDTKHVNENGETILHAACRFGEYDIVVYLTESHRYLVDMKDNDHNTPLHHASVNGNINIFRYLQQVIDIEVVNKHLENVLHCACRGGNHMMVNNLLSYYKSEYVFHVQNKNGLYPVHVAAEHGDRSILYLFPSKVRGHRTKSGDTILHISCRAGNKDITDYILNEISLQYMVPYKNYEGKTAMDCAVDAGHLEIVKLFRK